MKKIWRVPVVLMLGAGVLAIGSHFTGDWVAQSVLPAAQAAGGVVKSPTGTAPNRYVYYPGTEELKPDEIRLFACGTGMPSASDVRFGS